jgi:hypothetical protein
MSTTEVDEQLRGEARRFSLRFGCESCVHFAPEAQQCGNGYPTEPHRNIDLSRVSQLEFCKDFEVA